MNSNHKSTHRFTLDASGARLADWVTELLNMGQGRGLSLLHVAKRVEIFCCIFAINSQLLLAASLLISFVSFFFFLHTPNRSLPVFFCGQRCRADLSRE